MTDDTIEATAIPLSKEELSPPSDSKHIIELSFDKFGDNQPDYPLVSLNFSKDQDQAAGEGTISLFYTEELYNSIISGDTFKIKAGWEYNGKKTLKEYLCGFVGGVPDTQNLNSESEDPESLSQTPSVIPASETASNDTPEDETTDSDEQTDDTSTETISSPRIKGNILELPIKDMGALLDVKTTADYTQKKRSEIIKDLIEKTGLKASINWGDNPDDVIDYHGETGSGTSESSGSEFSTGIYQRSCWWCASNYPNDFNFYEVSTDGTCPQCGATNSVVFDDWKLPIYEGSLTCKQCDCDYCACGREKISGSSLKLNITKFVKSTGPVRKIK